jgi:hypothetical protein
MGRRIEVSDCRRRAPRKPGHRVSALATGGHHSVVVTRLRVTGTILSLGFGASEKWVLPIWLLNMARRRVSSSLRTVKGTDWTQVFGLNSLCMRHLS